MAAGSFRSRSYLLSFLGRVCCTGVCDTRHKGRYGVFICCTMWTCRCIAKQDDAHTCVAALPDSVYHLLTSHMHISHTRKMCPLRCGVKPAANDSPMVSVAPSAISVPAFAAPCSTLIVNLCSTSFAKHCYVAITRHVSQHDSSVVTTVLTPIACMFWYKR